MSTLHIITPVSRTQNIFLIFVNLYESLNNIPVIWHIGYDVDINFTISDVNIPKSFRNINIKEYKAQKKSKYGDENRNIVLDELDRNSSDWVYLLDDDNIIHPNLESIVLKHDPFPEIEWIMFRQILRDGTVYLDPIFPPVLNAIDTGNSLLRLSAIGPARYETVIGKANDYTFYSRVYSHLCKKYERPEEHVVLLDEVGAYYNYLR